MSNQVGKPYQDVMVTVSARVYDEEDEGNAERGLELAVEKAWRPTGTRGRRTASASW